MLHCSKAASAVLHVLTILRWNCLLQLRTISPCKSVCDSKPLLQGKQMPVMIADMPKNDQVRVPWDLAQDGRIIAAANGESWPEYATRVLREAIARDLASAAQKITDRAKGMAAEEPKEPRPRRGSK
jgi:hypothetical protein